MRCDKCNKENREEAIYCKWCGEQLADKAQKLLQELVGMSKVKQQLRDILLTHEALQHRAKTNGIMVPLELNMLILGDSGMGKTTLVQIIQQLFHDNGIVKKEKAKIIDASDYDKFQADFDNNIMAARDGILCIENVQKLLPDGEVRSKTELDNLLNAMEQWEGNPIVILTGTESGLGEFVANNPGIARKFQYQFRLAPYTVEEILALTAMQLRKKYLLELTDDAQAKLERVFKQYFRDNTGIVLSANIAMQKAREIKDTVFRRDARTDKVLAEDIPGKEFVRKTTKKVLAEFDQYVGVENIKEEVRKIANKIEVDAEREGTNAKRQINDHFVFVGNPGTGKTTIARLFADMLNAMDVLPVGQLVEVSRKDLVAQYVGQTAPLVTQWVDKAMGGVLFIDEAYTLKQGDNDQFGQEAIDTLLKLMEDRRGQFVAIAAGYSKEMGEFLASNSGLASRFNQHIFFRDYTAEELTEIFRSMVKAKKMKLDAEAEQHIGSFFRKMYLSRQRTFGNAREVRNNLEKALKNQGNRLQEAKLNGTYSTDILSVLTREDIEGKEAMAEKNLDGLLADLDAFVGMDMVKKEIRTIAQKLQLDKRMLDMGMGDAETTPIHIVLTGNPGTGKTTVAKMLGKIFKAIGLMPTDKVVEKTRKDLISVYKNETALLVDKACDEAMGGILFIDEAYSLMPANIGAGKDLTGMEAVEALMKRMSDDSGKFVVICAGYAKEMADFLDNANPGFRSRFTNFIHIDDYTAPQLKQIFLSEISKKKRKLNPAAEDALEKQINLMVNQKDEHFGNVRDIIRLTEKVIMRQSSRLAQLNADEWNKQLVETIEETDIPYESPKKVNLNDCMKQLDELIGLDSVKKEVRELAETIMIEQKRAQIMETDYKMNMDHYLFMGNPGTGKTTVARIMANIFYTLGLLPTNKLTEVKRQDLVAGFMGQTSLQTAKVVKSAVGGVLFIDEAYALNEGAHDEFGQEAINTLLPLLLDYKNKLVCIAAGYSHEMQQWIATNSGLTSRFNKKIYFEDFDAGQLADIFRQMVRKNAFVMTPEAEQKMVEYFQQLYARRDRHFGNAREVGNYFVKVKQQQSSRLMALLSQGEVDKETLTRLMPEDMMI